MDRYPLVGWLSAPAISRKAKRFHLMAPNDKSIMGNQLRALYSPGGEDGERFLDPSLRMARADLLYVASEVACAWDGILMLVRPVCR